MCRDNYLSVHGHLNSVFTVAEAESILLSKCAIHINQLALNCCLVSHLPTTESIQFLLPYPVIHTKQGPILNASVMKPFGPQFAFLLKLISNSSS